MGNPPKEHYTVAWISALPIELSMAQCALDEYHGLFNEQDDPITYILGSIRGHNIVIVSPFAGVPGPSGAARITANVRRTFKNIRFGFLVGIGGGIPSERHDVRLGDVVVGIPGDGLGGVLPHDIGKHLGDGSFKITGHLNKPPDVVLSAVSALQSGYWIGRNRILSYITEMVERHPNLQGLVYDKTRSDELYEGSGLIVDRIPRKNPDPMIHYGIIASGSQLIKDANLRNRLGREFNVLCVEMEATGVVDALPCLVIRGISDYADSYKNDAWQWYAAATAAAYAKDLLSVIGPLRPCEDSGHPQALAAGQWFLQS
jgi:nucleoside phosphorylase